MGTEEKDLHDRLYVRNYDWLSTLCKKSIYVNRELSVKTLTNGIILPPKRMADNRRVGGVHDEHFNFIAGSAFKRDRNLNKIRPGIINGGYSVPESELTYYDEKIIYGGSIAGTVYEPTFLFLAASIWYCIKNPNQDTRIALVACGRGFDDVLKQRIYEFLDLLNISFERVIFCEKPMKFKEIIIPEPSICAWRDYCDEYSLVFEKIRENVVPGNYKKIYLTRREYNKRKNVNDYINEEYFENFYREKGFTIIAPEQYSLREQASIMMGADEVVSVLSSASLFSSSFLKSETRVVYLNRADIIDRTFETAVMLNQMNNLNYYFVDICYNFLNQSFDDGAYLLGPTTYWKEYIKTTYNEDVDISCESILEKYSYQYLKNWLLCGNSPKQYGWLKNIDNFDILNNMCRVILGQELDKSKYDVGLTKIELNQKVDELSKKLENANKELSNDTRLAKLSAIERQIGSVADVIQKAQLSSAERESLMKQNAALSAQIETQNNYIKYANLSLEKMQENNKLLSELCKSVTDKKDELAKENESLTAAVLKDRKIEELTSDLENSQNVISDLKNEADTLKENMSADISSKEHQIEELNSSLADSKNVILNLQNDVNALKEHITNMENSRSWKITKPLRAIKRLFSKG